jgi:hypothetical protein
MMEIGFRCGFRHAARRDDGARMIALLVEGLSRLSRAQELCGSC